VEDAQFIAVLAGILLFISGWAALAGSIMQNKGHELFVGVLIGFLLGPVGVLICAISKEKKPETSPYMDILGNPIWSGHESSSFQADSFQNRAGYDER
jgi:hypothetical protein